MKEIYPGYKNTHYFGLEEIQDAKIICVRYPNGDGLFFDRISDYLFSKSVNGVTQDKKVSLEQVICLLNKDLNCTNEEIMIQLKGKNVVKYSSAIGYLVAVLEDSTCSHYNAVLLESHLDAVSGVVISYRSGKVAEYTRDSVDRTMPGCLLGFNKNFQCGKKKDITCKDLVNIINNVGRSGMLKGLTFITSNGLEFELDV